MASARTPRARPPRARDDRTLGYFELPTPAVAPAIAPPPNDPRTTASVIRRTLGGMGRKGGAQSRVEEQWAALYEAGLLNLDAIAVLLPPSEEGAEIACDEIEAYVLRRGEAGTTVRVLVEMAPCSGVELSRALGRLIQRGRLRLM